MFSHLRPAVLLFLLLLLGGFLTLGYNLPQTTEAEVVQEPTRHAEFSRLLARYVDDQGRVDYAQLQQHADTTLGSYLEQLASTNPAQLSHDAQLAFWINAYNALALKVIVDHYPVKNIWATTPGSAKPGKEENPFKKKIAEVADTVRTLDEIEHQIIRERFDEPRIHFAVVCAATSCPPLRQEAYTGPRLDTQLDDQAQTFLHNEEKNKIPADEDRIALTRILKWFGSDFGPSTDAVQKYLARYFEGSVQERLSQAEYQVEFLQYDWSLNAQGEVESKTASSD